MPSKYFVVSYTNKVKDYCDKQFFDRFNEIAKGHQSLVVDNSVDKTYWTRLCELVDGNVITIDVDQDPVGLFQRNVAESVSLCREKFLESDADIMVILESDVIPPAGLLSMWEERIKWLTAIDQNLKPWGILGGLYYPGFHDFSLDGLHETHHVLSGCTAYRRELVEKYPFRYDPNNLGAFPDALICFDAGKEYSLWNDHDIVCRHLHRGDGGRMSYEL